jgi:hypothetical protein
MSNMKNSAHARRFHPNACNRIWAARVFYQSALAARLPQDLRAAAGQPQDVQTALLPTSVRAAVDGVALL